MRLAKLGRTLLGRQFRPGVVGKLVQPDRQKQAGRAREGCCKGLQDLWAHAGDDHCTC